MRKLFKILIGIITILIAIVAILFIVLYSTEWRPKSIESKSFSVEEVEIPDTLTIVSWNIGYGGLGDDMDFFYDGGEKSRTSKERTLDNLTAIVGRLKLIENADFILLQEVDVDSHRSYNIDERQLITSAFHDYHSAFAYNYNSIFVPLPLSDPMGKVKSGLLTLSQLPIAKSIRYQYPTIVELPNRFFDLKRAMLSIGIALTDSDTLWVNNIHNTAFDSGNMRQKEIGYLKNIVENQHLSITAGDWNSTPPWYEASKAATNNRFFAPYPLKGIDLPNNTIIATDINTSTMRYLDKPYDKDSTTTTILDFGVISSNFEILEYKVVDLDFKNSDHNPIMIKIAIKRVIKY